MKHLECAKDPISQTWIYALIIVLSFFISDIIGAIPLLIVFVFDSSGMSLEYILNNPQDSTLSTNLILALMLIPACLFVFILLTFIKTLHGRTYIQTINGKSKIRWERIRTGAIACFIIRAISLTIEYIIYPEDFILQFDLSSFIPLLFISILMIPLQATGEELAFRGYLAQGIGILTNNRWLVLIIPSLLFGLAHYANPEVQKYGLGIMMSQYIALALIYGIIVLLDDGLELAIGMHAANNIFASLFTTFDGSVFQTMAVFKIINIAPSYIDALFILLTEGILVVYFYKKYKWNFSIMNKRIHNRHQPIETESINR